MACVINTGKYFIRHLSLNVSRVFLKARHLEKFPVPLDTKKMIYKLFHLVILVGCLSLLSCTEDQGYADPLNGTENYRNAYTLFSQSTSTELSNITDVTISTTGNSTEPTANTTSAMTTSGSTEITSPNTTSTETTVVSTTPSKTSEIPTVPVTTPSSTSEKTTSPSTTSETTTTTTTPSTKPTVTTQEITTNAPTTRSPPLTKGEVALIVFFCLFITGIAIAVVVYYLRKQRRHKDDQRSLIG